MAEERVVRVVHWYLLSIVCVVAVCVAGIVINEWFRPRHRTLLPEDARLRELLQDPTMQAVRQEFLDREDYVAAAFQSLRMSALHEYVRIKLGGVGGLEARPTPYELEALYLFGRAGHKDAYEKLLERKYGKDWSKSIEIDARKPETRAGGTP